VHKDRQLDLVGWYTLLSAEGPTSTILPVHTQLLQGYNESAILLGFHPQEAVSHSVGGKLPLTIYESNYEVDDIKGAPDGEDKKMDDGEPTLKLKFREINYSVETDETEMISMNYIAGSGGNATASATKGEKPGAPSAESNGKGKRKLGEDEEGLEAGRIATEDISLSREDDEMIAALTAKANAIKMLHSRIQLLITYLKGLPPGFDGTSVKSEDENMNADATTPSHTVLRQIQALVSRMDLVIPSNEQGFNSELLHESNDVHLIGLLNNLMQSVGEAKKVGKKFDVVEKGRNSRSRGDFHMPYNLAGAGDLIM
jgi:COP9 signalosome complex subunit 6